MEGGPITGGRSVLQDADGNRYIDYHAAFGPIILGHNFEAVNCRVAEAMQ